MIRTREAVILAGGFGTRISSIVKDVPKPMANVAGRPFLRFILDQLSDNGFDLVVIADGYKRECIEEYFGSSYRGMRLVYSPEDSPLLTGGAVKKALGYCSNDWVYVLNGDTFLEIDFEDFESAAASSSISTVAILSSKEMKDFDRYGTLEITSDNKIRAFKEKQPCSRGLINAGVYLLKANALHDCPCTFSLESDFFEKIVSRGVLSAVLCEGAFIDIGIPDDYRRAQSMLSPLVHQWKLAFFDRDGTINVDTHHLYEPEKLKLIPEGVTLLKSYSSRADYKTVVVTNQSGIARGIYTENDMFLLHDALDRRLEKYDCKIDAYYFCPHHPDFTGPCECRKPKPGMLLKAMFDYDANPSECIMFGDKTSDVQAAQNAHVKGVLCEYAR